MSTADLNLLVTLDVLLAEGSVARAAQRLRLSPSAMSRALARLRATTGDPLLVRAGRGLVPTPRALELREQVGPLVQAAEAALRPVERLDLERLVRTYTDRHGLKELVREMLGTDISKQQQSSDWGGPVLSEAQKDYAASDVRYLHRLHAEFVKRLEREGRTAIAQACFDFLPHRANLDLIGWPEADIFAHA